MATMVAAGSTPILPAPIAAGGAAGERARIVSAGTDSRYRQPARQVRAGRVQPEKVVAGTIRRAATAGPVQAAIVAPATRR